MSVLTLEAYVENGIIRLADGMHLPEGAKVYVVVPDIQIERKVHLYSPRLVHPEQAAEFELEMIEEIADASV